MATGILLFAPIMFAFAAGMIIRKQMIFKDAGYPPSIGMLLIAAGLLFAAIASTGLAAQRIETNALERVSPTTNDGPSTIQFGNDAAATNIAAVSIIYGPAIA